MCGRWCSNSVACFGLVCWPEDGAMILSGAKQAVLVLPFCFVTFILGKQNKSKKAVVKNLPQISLAKNKKLSIQSTYIH